MAKAKKERRKHNINIPVAAGIAVALGAPAVYGLATTSGAPLQARLTATAQKYAMNFSGYDPINQQWALGNLAQGYGPILAGGLIHKGFSMLGITRMVSAAKLGFTV